MPRALLSGFHLGIKCDSCRLWKGDGGIDASLWKDVACSPVRSAVIFETGPPGGGVLASICYIFFFVYILTPLVMIACWITSTNQLTRQLCFQNYLLFKSCKGRVPNIRHSV